MLNQIKILVLDSDSAIRATFYADFESEEKLKAGLSGALLETAAKAVWLKCVQLEFDFALPGYMNFERSA